MAIENKPFSMINKRQGLHELNLKFDYIAHYNTLQNTKQKLTFRDGSYCPRSFSQMGRCILPFRKYIIAQKIKMKYARRYSKNKRKCSYNAPFSKIKM